MSSPAAIHPILKPECGKFNQRRRSYCIFRVTVMVLYRLVRAFLAYRL